MDAKTFLTTILDPAWSAVPGQLSFASAKCWLHAVAGVESEWTYRIQKPVGYAHGFWQCEKHGAVMEIVTNPRTRGIVLQYCTAHRINPGLDSVFDEIISNDALACLIARLVALLDPAPIPAIGDQAGSYAYYLRNWRPGKPDRARWAEVYPQSVALFSWSPSGP